MRFLIAVCVLCCASVAQAERVKVCGPNGCYFLDRTVVTAGAAVKTTAKATARVVTAPARCIGGKCRRPARVTKARTVDRPVIFPRLRRAVASVRVFH